MAIDLACLDLSRVVEILSVLLERLDYALQHAQLLHDDTELLAVYLEWMLEFKCLRQVQQGVEQGLVAVQCVFRHLRFQNYSIIYHALICTVYNLEQVVRYIFRHWNERVHGLVIFSRF